ncbi:MAG TPA: hypothetical protein VH186_01130 [Chloroflexia bacterium]|nr:hypothetical protein [Chloroflexia bacterium]
MDREAQAGRTPLYGQLCPGAGAEVGVVPLWQAAHLRVDPERAGRVRGAGGGGDGAEVGPHLGR